MVLRAGQDWPGKLTLWQKSCIIMFTQIGHWYFLYHTPWYSKNYLKKWSGKIYEPEEEECCKMLCFGHTWTSYSWTHGDYSCMNRIDSLKTPSWMEEGLTSSPDLIEELLTIDGFFGRDHHYPHLLWGLWSLIGCPGCSEWF